MSRISRVIAAAAAFAALGATTASAYDAGLVRIEPRPYYGAVVTMEQGVRVYRPLPTQNLMIINPNQTPINLSFSRTIEHKAADASSGAAASDNGGGNASGGGVGYPYGFANGGRGGNGNKHRASGHAAGGKVVHRHRPMHKH